MDILRYVAFSNDPAGGNPAGVVLDASGLTDDAMLAAAAAVGYSETAFLTSTGDGTYDVRYFSPEMEVPFCGHATIASAVAVADIAGAGDLSFQTKAGLIQVSTTDTGQGMLATLTSVMPKIQEIDAHLVAQLLAALGWPETSLDPSLPIKGAYAGAWHPIVAAGDRSRLAELDYDFEALKALMVRHDWATINLLWREDAQTFHARNPFPPGGVVEDPATGAAAAALGGYLRELGAIEPPADITIHQGADMGRPSTIYVSVPPDQSGILVSGTAVSIEVKTQV